MEKVVGAMRIFFASDFWLLTSLSFELSETLEQAVDVEGGGDHADDQTDDEPQRRGVIFAVYPPADQRRHKEHGRNRQRQADGRRRGAPTDAATVVVFIVRR